jgi:hypothetical protein
VFLYYNFGDTDLVILKKEAKAGSVKEFGISSKATFTFF